LLDRNDFFKYFLLFVHLPGEDARGRYPGESGGIGRRTRLRRDYTKNYNESLVTCCN